MTCANCSRPADYLHYQGVTQTVYTPYCSRHIPSFLRIGPHSKNVRHVSTLNALAEKIVETRKKKEKLSEAPSS